MAKSLSKALPELVDAGLITEAQSSEIQRFYAEQDGEAPQQRMLLIFGILGAMLVGLGIILIVAHNWDQLSQLQKVSLALLPTLIGQLVAGLTLARRPEALNLREGSATFLLLALGASLSLVSQIYHLDGNLDSYLLTWMLLGLPLIYVLRSSMASLLYLVGITAFGCAVGYARPTAAAYSPYLYFLLLGAAMPFYYWLSTRKGGSNFTRFHHWLVALSLITTAGTLIDSAEFLILPLYMSLFGLLYLIGHIPYFDDRPQMANAYLSLGSLGSSLMLLIASFQFFWQGLAELEEGWRAMVFTPGFGYLTLLTLGAVGLLVWQVRQQGESQIDPRKALFLLFLVIFQVGFSAPMWAFALTNVVLLVLGVLTIRNGVQQQHLGLLNYGLLILTAQIICRFFDINLSFVLKGVIFILVGLGFFLANYWMIRQKRQAEKSQASTTVDPTSPS